MTIGSSPEIAIESSIKRSDHLFVPHTMSVVTFLGNDTSRISTEVNGFVEGLPTTQKIVQIDDTYTATYAQATIHITDIGTTSSKHGTFLHLCLDSLTATMADEANQ